MLQEADSELSRVGDDILETTVSEMVEVRAFKKPPKKGSASWYTLAKRAVDAGYFLADR